MQHCCVEQRAAVGTRADQLARYSIEHEAELLCRKTCIDFGGDAPLALRCADRVVHRRQGCGFGFSQHLRDQSIARGLGSEFAVEDGCTAPNLGEEVGGKNFADGIRVQTRQADPADQGQVGLDPQSDERNNEGILAIEILVDVRRADPCAGGYFGHGGSVETGSYDAFARAGEDHLTALDPRLFIDRPPANRMFAAFHIYINN